MAAEISGQELQDLYWGEELSERQIAAKLGISRGPVRYQRAKHQIPCRERGEATSISRVKPLLNPSAELSYVLGVLLGDGSVSIFQCGPYMRGGRSYSLRIYRVALAVTNYFFVRSFFEALEKIGLHPRIELKKHHSCKQGFLYEVRANSKRFAEWYKDLSLDDIKKIVTQDRDYSLSFVKGFYESEGTFNKNERNRSITMSNTKKDILGLVVRVLSSVEIPSKLWGPCIRDRTAFWGKHYIYQEFVVGINRKNTERLMELWVDRSMETWKHGG